MIGHPVFTATISELELNLVSGRISTFTKPASRTNARLGFSSSATGEVIAGPDFNRGNTSFSGNMTNGQSDNQGRDAIVTQIVAYTARNK